MRSDMKKLLLSIVIGVVLFLNPNNVIFADQNKIVDIYTRGEIIPEKALCWAKALTDKEVFIGGKTVMITRSGDLVEVLKKGVDPVGRLWMIRTKGGYVYTEYRENIEIVDDQVAKQDEEQKVIGKVIILGTLEDIYQKVVRLYNAKKYQEAMKEVNKFVVYGRDDYKDIEQLYIKIRIAELEQYLKNHPDLKAIENLYAYEALLKLDPTNPLYKKKVAYYQAKYERERIAEEEKEKKRAIYDLELVSWHWSKVGGHVIVEGQVKNISGEILRNIAVLITWYDKIGKEITYVNSLIEYNPIISGQTYPFKVTEKYHPAMEKASIEFKFMGGSGIPTCRK